MIQVISSVLVHYLDSQTPPVQAELVGQEDRVGPDTYSREEGERQPYNISKTEYIYIYIYIYIHVYQVVCLSGLVSGYIYIYVMYKPWPRGVYVRYTPAVRKFICDISLGPLALGKYHK